MPKALRGEHIPFGHLVKVILMEGTEVELACPEEAMALTQVQKATFDDDTMRHLGRPRGGPFGYDSVSYCQSLISERRAYTIKKDGIIVGGAFVTEELDGMVRINRLFIRPDHQGQGLGKHALHELEALFPRAKGFVLDTPVWANRNQHFYQSLGYVRVGETLEQEHGFMLVVYEKHKEEGR